MRGLPCHVRRFTTSYLRFRSAQRASTIHTLIHHQQQTNTLVWKKILSVFAQHKFVCFLHNTLVILKKTSFMSRIWATEIAIVLPRLNLRDQTDFCSVTLVQIDQMRKNLAAAKVRA
jgi:ABC-type maltose transport system permease subunit